MGRKYLVAGVVLLPLMSACVRNEAPASISFPMVNAANLAEATARAEAHCQTYGTGAIRQADASDGTATWVCADAE